MSKHGESSTEEDCVDHEDFKNLSMRLEQLHTEAKAFRSETSNTMHAIDKRIARLEFEDEKKEERLGAGAATMSKLGEQIERVNSKIDTPWYKVVGFIMPALFAVLSVVWQMARNPSGVEFQQLREQVWKVQSHQESTEQKIDLLLRKP